MTDTELEAIRQAIEVGRGDVDFRWMQQIAAKLLAEVDRLRVERIELSRQLSCYIDWCGPLES